MTDTRPLPQDPARCKRKRIAAGWTQQELADLSGLGNSTIHRIENGEVAASVDSLKALARAFQCEIADLLPAEIPAAGR